MLLPIMAFVFVAYLVVGLAMPVVPLYVHDDLGLSTFVVGLVAGSPFAAALLSRLGAGRFTDRRGAKRSVTVGLLAAAAGGACFLLSLAAFPSTAVSVVLLMAGRALLGVADSFTITGALSWGLALLGTQKTGIVMAWVGTAIYIAFAIGAPLGSVLYARDGFLAIALATIAVPLVALVLLARLPVVSIASPHSRPVSLARVARAVWQPGLAVALGGVGFGAITAFIALLFVERGWTPVWLAFSLLSAAFIIGRLLFGGLADTVGGAKVAFVCVLIEAVGLALIWRAASMPVALAGVMLGGFGYSLMYPALGSEALRRTPAHERGITMGAYTAFLDLSLGISGPLLGRIAASGLQSVYAASALLALAAAVVTLVMRRNVGDDGIEPPTFSV